MWCYQKPDFEALLLAELQRQQQCSQFCDTLLKAGGLSVPAHSCILSAISPQFSSCLSSTPAPPAGQSRLLEFQALGACTLLHMVRLLYSGEMAGEGEMEKQEAISAAAKLGIHGLVEVTQKERKRRNGKEGCQYTEVGVQTEPLMFEETETSRGGWRRVVRDGNTLLWRETLPSGGRETWTQTEELQCSPASQLLASFNTIDLNAVQSLRQTDSHLVLPQVPYASLSLVYTADENQTSAVPSCSSLSAFAQETPAAGHTPTHTLAPPSVLSPVPSQVPACAADPQTWWSGSHAAGAGEELADDGYEQFEGNIPGFINYILKPEKEQGDSRGRGARRRRASRGTETGETRARRPRARGAGGGRGRLTQTVDVQDVGVSRFAKMFLQRWRMQPNKTGQGGGAAGRKLYVKTREAVKSGRSSQRRGRGKEWNLCESGYVQPKCETGGGAKRRQTAQQINADGLSVPKAWRGRPKSTPGSFCSPPVHFYSVDSPSPSIQSPLVHTPLPHPAPPPPEDQPEHIERLLEEVMMGLDILPNKELPSSGSSCTVNPSGNTCVRNKQQSSTIAPGFHESPKVVPVAAAASESANGDMPILQQQAEGELSDILDHFLQSFERHIGSCTTREEEESSGQSSTEPYTVQSKNKIKITTPHTPHQQLAHTPRPAETATRCDARRSQITELQRSGETGIPPRHSQPGKTSAHRVVPPKRKRKVTTSAKRRKKNDYLFSLEKRRVKSKKPELPSDAKKKPLLQQVDKQLQQMPVVKLERSGPLPMSITLQGLSYKGPAKTNSRSRDPGPEKNQFSWSTKVYPIRSRFREAHIMESMPFLKEPISDKRSPPARRPHARRGRPRKNGCFPSLSEGDISRAAAQRDEGEQEEKTQDRHEDESTAQPQEEEEEPARRGRKRRMESEGETDDDGGVVKRFCPEPQPTCEVCSESAQHHGEAAATEVIDIETVSLSSGGDTQLKNKHEIRGEETDENVGESLMDEDMESIDVDGESSDLEKDKDDCREGVEKFCCLDRSAATWSSVAEGKPLVSLPPEDRSLGSTGSLTEDKDDDIDVIGGSGPLPNPIIISWTDSEGEEDDEIDVVGEKTDYTSVFLSKGELVNKKYHTEVILH